ncbi:MAG: SDR family NAD(P)-dependent oxidoreductase [Thermoanaerobaculaceae bacterium]|nr:SDR family NAD(P)-dependent oxidoreductase [Thermoanaerobaculaceae bacterium]MDI9623030.1 SDR family NAD(P)-dependent oxidoreductase [Acidobacteriota bacterium]NLH12087.1 SDR family NAD(P)-dependent oxidoreductase [Holophagae bacterium]HPW55009.1 SDR family NAD(P)-dependent oxidoreductase [Thermoanaerobaculaceae bacterium]
MSNGRWAVVTGASSGIGEATARALAKVGFEVMVGARRMERLEALAAEIGGQAMRLDVADAASVETFCAAVPAELAVLVNNAGGALGLEPVAQARDIDWLTMIETNVLGLMRVTRALLPRLLAGRGHIVNVTSIAGREVYPNGAGYTAAKHAARAVTQTLRMELNGTPVRVTDVAPGLVETEFSRVRFFGDVERAKKTYEGLTPLTAADIADCVVWAVTRPAHVNVDEIVVKPVAQATASMVARGRGL